MQINIYIIIVLPDEPLFTSTCDMDEYIIRNVERDWVIIKHFKPSPNKYPKHIIELPSDCKNMTRLDLDYGDQYGFEEEYGEYEFNIDIPDYVVHLKLSGYFNNNIVKNVLRMIEK